LLEREIDGTKFRLIGIGLSSLVDANAADLADLLDHRSAEAEKAIDRLRAKFGNEAVFRGLTLDEDDDD
jgi:DNA polymerase IV